MPESEDPLGRQLDQWAVPSPPPDLSAQVWRRIASADQAAGFWERFEVWFTRPSFAGAFIISCLLLGLFLAEVRVAHLQRERNIQLARNYLRLIDPLFRDQAAPRP